MYEKRSLFFFSGKFLCLTDCGPLSNNIIFKVLNEPDGEDLAL